MFQVPSQIESIATRVDGSIKLVIGTQELPPEQAAEVFNLKGKQGWFVFSENTISEQEVPDEQAPEFSTDKTPSQRLRSNLYVYWEKNTKKTKSFNTFYNEWVEKKIKEIQEQLV